jgi:ParB family chromosome partitioning protein
LRVLRLPERVREDVIFGRLSMGHARALLALDGEADLLEARAQVVGKNLSVRETEALVKRIKNFKESSKRNKPGGGDPDPELVHLAGRLQHSLGTQVKIVPRGKGGKIEISYFSPEDLGRLLEILKIG